MPPGTDDEVVAPDLNPRSPGEPPAPRRFQPIPETLLVVYLLHDPPGREEHPGEVYPRRQAPEAIVGKLLRVPHEPCGLGECPGRDASVVGAGPAKLLSLDQDDLGP